MSRLVFLSLTAFLTAAALAQRPAPARVNEASLAVAERTGYHPVIPVPNQDIVNPNAVTIPNWLKTQPSPAFAGKPIVTHHVFPSAALGMDVGYSIYLPPDYASSDRRYPVVYWLHGSDGNEYRDIALAAYPDAAIRKGDLDPAIIVYANGFAGSFYVDFADGRFLAETVIIRELIPHIDGAYRTIASRAGRHISGMSMGGFGCLHLAFKYPELFGSVVAYGAAILLPSEHEEYAKLGVRISGTVGRFVAEHPVTLVEKNADAIRGRTRIRIVCGTRDRVLIEPSRRFHDRLVKLGIEHDYEELAPFGHDINGMAARSGAEGMRFALARAGN